MTTAKTRTAEKGQVLASVSAREERVEVTDSAAELAEQRVTLHGIRWETYERLLKDLESSGAPRLTYDRGTLEIMSPLPRHERSNRILATLVEAITEEWGQEVDNLGSTTFRRQDVERGFEPDSCFYIQHAEAVRDKAEIDLSIDPPPDLVIEIDPPTVWAPAHSCLPKLPIYAQFGVPEVWRYDGSARSILVLGGGEYQERGESTVLPGVDRDGIDALLRDRRSLGCIPWLRRVRDWARRQRRTGDKQS